MKLEWGEPPKEALNPRASAGFYGQIAKLLRERPHEWAKVPREFASEDSAKGAAANIRNGRMQAMPKGMYQSAADGKHVWVRFHPENDDAIPPDEEDDDEGHPNVRRIGASRTYDPAAVRAWAAGQGIEISKHGRLPADLLARYEEAKEQSEQ